MFETLMSLSQFTTVRWHCAGDLRSRHGSDFWFVVPSNLFACADGWVYVNVVPAFWDPLTVFLDNPELLVDERFATNDLRMQHRDALHEITAHAIALFSKDEIAEKAAECRIPLGVVQTFDDVLEDRHLAARGFWEQVHGPNGRVLKTPSLPYRINNAPSGTWPSARPMEGQW
jgi:crotonobetainyl-CoA:carnitine CoA-transferase CaiB-like acyl-CoA transferase